MITIITLIVLLISVLFIKSTTITVYGKCRKAKVPVLIPILVAILAFIPIVKWVVMFVTPLVTVIWYASDGSDDYDRRTVKKISEDTLIGKILLFKI